MKEKELKSFIVNTVHDSVITEESPDEGDVITELAEQAFIEDVLFYLKKVYNINFDVPLKVDHKTGTHWGEIDE